MPIYEYECQQCGIVVEKWQKRCEDAAEPCPDCSGRLKKVISGSAFVLKGTGWYVTDYARKGTSSPSSS